MSRDSARMWSDTSGNSSQGGLLVGRQQNVVRLETTSGGLALRRSLHQEVRSFDIFLLYLCVLLFLLDRLIFLST